jgi:hypothetical protein
MNQRISCLHKANLVVHFGLLLSENEQTLESQRTGREATKIVWHRGIQAPHLELGTWSSGPLNEVEDDERPAYSPLN